MKNSATSRERELYRYYQPGDPPEHSGDPDVENRKSSNDPILTAFAQLGALRLNAKRGIITLSTTCREFIIAESGQSLSLQNDNDDQDLLWHGIGAMDCGTGAGPEMTSWFCESDETHIVVNDLTLDDGFKDKEIVTKAPFARFLCAVPLRTPGYGVVIGTYIIVDDKIRDGLHECELQFLSDMGVTVMDYLQSGLIKHKQHRAERMVKAMGLFIEGKATLRDWWMELGHKSQQVQVQKRSSNSVPLETQADAEFGVQDPADSFQKNGLNGLTTSNHRPSLTRSASSSAHSISNFGDGRPMLPRGQSHISSTEISTPSAMTQAWTDRHSSVTTVDSTDGLPEKHSSVSFDLPPEQPSSADVSKELQDAVMTEDLRGVFARASNLIREAIGVEGVIYFDASVGSFGGASTRSVMEEKPPGVFKVDGVLSDNEEFGRRMSVASFGISEQAVSSAHDTDSAPEKFCNILGFSTRTRSTLRGHPSSEQHRSFPETILRRLLKRYPHGKVFNFDEDGQMSSDSDPASSGVETPAETASSMPASIELKARRKRQSREAEAKAILKILPGARSVFWFPLWAAGRDRWFAGSLVWSASPTRILCPIEDLTYLAAFGNSAMAEVSRLSAALLAQMKTDFISSISHELRSPLHGVLASVEFLQETDMTEVQADMVGNIHASGKVLLDTINHVLDFSKVNRKSRNKGRISRKTAKRFRKSRQQGITEDVTVDDNSNICILSEEVIESIYAGHRVRKHAFGSSTDRHLSNTTVDAPVTVIVDIAWKPNWTFDIDAGAWRRILMNLFSNAMKYTKTGFIRISLNIEEDVASRSRQQRSNLILTITDSGKGISQEFMKHQLFKPFKQEDSLASGAGLGLSIIRHIIHDLGGQIDFLSEQGTGTEVKVKIPLTAASPFADSSTNPPDIADEVKNVTKGFEFSLEGFERYPDISEAPTGILTSDIQAALYLKATTIHVLTQWFDMDASAVGSPFGASNTDVVFIMEAGIGKKSLNEILEPYSRNREPGGKRPIAIMLCNSYHPSTKTEPHEHFNVFHLQQPYGPHKLAKIFHKVLCQTPSPVVAEPRNGVKNSLFIRPTSILYEADESLITPTVTFSPVTFSNTALPIRQPEVQESKGLWTREPKLNNQPDLWSRPAAEKEAVQITTTPAAPESDSLRVLLVEDNEINLKLLVAYMRKLKLPHTTATNGLEALDAYKDCNGAFDVVFMDISMPIMSGIESTQRIRRFEREKGLTPVALIALTGAANPDTRQEAFSSGVDLFLTKPVPMKALKVMLDDLKKHGRDFLNQDDQD